MMHNWYQNWLPLNVLDINNYPGQTISGHSLGVVEFVCKNCLGQSSHPIDRQDNKKKKRICIVSSGTGLPVGGLGVVCATAPIHKQSELRKVMMTWPKWKFRVCIITSLTCAARFYTHFSPAFGFYLVFISIPFQWAFSFRHPKRHIRKYKYMSFIPTSSYICLPDFFLPVFRPDDNSRSKIKLWQKSISMPHVNRVFNLERFVICFIFFVAFACCTLKT